MGRLTFGVVLVAALATLAASCGGGGGSSSSTALSKTDFISQADAICTKYDQQFTNDVQPTYPSSDPTAASTSDEDVKKFADPLSATHDLYSKQLDELRALTPPADFQTQYASALSSLDTSLSAISEAADAAANADRQGVTVAVQKGQTASTAANTIAQAYGLKVCGKS
jgi:hypothetical protein